MPGTYLNYPFDEELFINAWYQEPDLVRTALIDSGVLVNDELIASRVATGSNSYSIPFYNDIGGTPVNLDGATDLTASETTGDSQEGIVYGRGLGWTARDFVGTLSGNNPMGNIVSRVARFWHKNDNRVLVGILGALFGITGNDKWTKHTVDMSSSTATPAKIEATSINDAITDALGDNKGAFKVAIMHSTVARTLENLQILEYFKQNDANGIQRPTGLGMVNGLTVIIDDGVPATAVGGSGANKDLIQYTTYLLGTGVIRFAPARLESPAAEVSRDPAKNGGQETLWTRQRQTFHPNGFSFVKPNSGFTESPTDAQLFAKANWKLVHDPKSIPLARLITNG